MFGARAASAQTADTQTADAQTLTGGIFRENATDISESQRNCWTQAMVSGQTINGEIMAQNLTEQKAQFELQSLAKRGLCAAERTSTTWSARGQGHHGHGDSGYWRVLAGPTVAEPDPTGIMRQGLTTPATERTLI